MDRSEVTARSGLVLQGAIGLDGWVARHGPLWPPLALSVALDICSRVSWLPPHELARSIGSLDAAHVVRREAGGWSWSPTAVGSADRSVPDAEIVGRLGAILFQSLTGEALAYPFTGEQALRATLRRLRPELPTSVADLIIEAVLTSNRPGLTLATFARDVRQGLVVERADRRRSHRAWRRVAAAGAVPALLLGLWWAIARGEADGREDSALTRGDAAQLEVFRETAQTFGLIEEHTAAIQLYQHMESLRRARLPPEDPRLAWNEASEAWIRTLAGDRITPEQYLGSMPASLGRELGEAHPYTRTVRLMLADTLEARGAKAEAASLRNDAERGTRDLFQGTGLTSDGLERLPMPPGVLAHVHPTAPEREGFRRGPKAGFFMPLTSPERWMATHAGWRLFVIATSSCDVSLVPGTDPRLIAVDVNRSPAGSWQVRVGGIKPARTFDAPPANKVGVSLVSHANGEVEIRLGNQIAGSSGIDTAIAPPEPPHALAFDGGPSGTGCSVVWLEIPFPSSLNFHLR